MTRRSVAGVTVRPARVVRGSAGWRGSRWVVAVGRLRRIVGGQRVAATLPLVAGAVVGRIRVRGAGVRAWRRRGRSRRHVVRGRATRRARTVSIKAGRGRRCHGASSTVAVLGVVAAVRGLWIAGIGWVVGVAGSLEARVGRLATRSVTLLVVRVLVIRHAGALRSLASRLVAPGRAGVLADTDLQALLREHSRELRCLCTSVSIHTKRTAGRDVLCIPGNFFAE